MAITVEQLTEAALSLRSETRALLAGRQVESLDPVRDREIQALGATAAARRRDEVRNGRVEPVAGPAALERVRQTHRISQQI